MHTPARFEGYAVPRHPLDAPRDGPGIHVLVDFHLLNVGIFLAFCAIIPSGKPSACICFRAFSIIRAIVKFGSVNVPFG